MEMPLYLQRHLARPNAEWRERMPRLYNLTMDPFEKYDMCFNGAMASRFPKTSPGQYAGDGQRLGLWAHRGGAGGV